MWKIQTTKEKQKENVYNRVLSHFICVLILFCVYMKRHIFGRNIIFIKNEIKKNRKEKNMMVRLPVTWLAKGVEVKFGGLKEK